MYIVTLPLFRLFSYVALSQNISYEKSKSTTDTHKRTHNDLMNNSYVDFLWK